MDINITLKLDSKKVLRSKSQPLIEGVNAQEKEEQEKEPSTEAIKSITMYISADGEISEKPVETMGDIQREHKPELTHDD